MTQHDYLLNNDLGAAYRGDLNAVLLAIVSNNMGDTAPAVTRPGMLWMGVVAGTDGTLRVRDAQDGAWLVVGTGSQHLPLTGGVVTGNLAVAGIFSNPEFNLAKGSFASTTPPANPSPGQLWGDLNYTPGLLKIRNPGNTAWVEVVDKSSPNFTDTLTIVSSAPGNAQLNLISAGEKRRITGEASGNRWAFYGLNDVLLGSISDAGDLYLAALGNVAISTVLAGKQAALGFTPIEQVGAPIIQIGGAPAHLWLGGVDQGEISVGAGVPQFMRADIGSYTFAHPAGQAVQYGSTVNGSILFYYPSGEAVGSGSWRVMDMSLGNGVNGLFHRVA